jgi:prepilin-type N-terminal cleavage/methylation domain-containing protein
MLKLRLKKQGGYSLAEFMVGLAVIGILAGLLGVAVPQMTSIPEKGGAQVEALHNLQNVIHWIGVDAGSAQSAAGGGSLTLTMPDDSVISYTLTSGVLYRNIAGDAQPVGRSISALAFTVSDRLITLEITAAPESRWGISESRTYQVAMRPSGT